MISKFNIFPNKQTFHIHITTIKIKNHKKQLISISNLKLRKYNCMSKIFPKINLKFYSNFTTHNQTY